MENEQNSLANDPVSQNSTNWFKYRLQLKTGNENGRRAVICWYLCTLQ